MSYWLTRWLADGTQAASTYAVLVGWWFTLYVVSKAVVPARSAMPVALGYLILFVAVAFASRNWLYRDASLLPITSVIEVGVLQAFAVVSPILLDAALRKMVRRFA